MKKAAVLLFIIMLALPITTWAEGYARSSGEKTATATIYNGKCVITAVEVITDGTNNATVIVYDALSTDGKVVLELTVNGGNHYGGRVFLPPVQMTTGIHAVISGTGASYIVEYKVN